MTKPAANEIDVGDCLHIVVNGLQHYFVFVEDVCPREDGPDYYVGTDRHENTTWTFEYDCVVGSVEL